MASIEQESIEEKLNTGMMPVKLETMQKHGRDLFMIHGERVPSLGHWSSTQIKTPVHEDVLWSQRLEIERKKFVLTLRENSRGRFLRIVEEKNGRHNMVIIPLAGFEGFKQLLDEMVRVSNAPR